MASKKVKEFYFDSWFIGQLRRIFRRYPPYYQTLNENKEIYYIKSKNGKDLKRVSHKCVKCGRKFTQSNIRVDHIEPSVPVTGFPLQPNGEKDWNAFLKRYFINKDGLQKLCVDCHDVKTKEENKQRKINKSLTKK